MISAHYIPTGEGESIEGFRERKLLQSKGQYSEETQINLINSLLGIEQIINKGKEIDTK